ncbi:SDR family NAD(P)-dependent oxidoreductase [Leucobacter edaphi]|uniref:SDR family NAD(P)-dependent oxidoreductase n=1 Tax=Leucobacter edaphi TaxID=2796472 RepID=UPI0034E1F17D
MPEGTVVMTGASRGIGRIAAERLLREHEDLNLVVIGRQAPAEQRAAFGQASWRVTALRAELASLGQTADAAGDVADLIGAGRLPPVRALAWNAGLQRSDAIGVSPDGFEETFAVNLLAPHLLTRSLEGLLEAGSRVVVTVSDTHFGDLRHNLGMVPGPVWAPIERLLRPGGYPRSERVRAGRTAYSTSKLAAIYLVHEWARRLTGAPIVSFNPGFVPGTGLARAADPLSRFAMRWLLPALTLTPLGTSPQRAGEYLARAIVSDDPPPSGSYIDRNRIAPSSAESMDPSRERAVWEACEAAIAPYLER